jgi:hypothetical protein
MSTQKFTQKKAYIDPKTRSGIHNCPQMETTRCSSTGEQINKLVHSDNGILLRTKKNCASKPRKDMEETYMRITK